MRNQKKRVSLIIATSHHNLLLRSNELVMTLSQQQPHDLVMLPCATPNNLNHRLQAEVVVCVSNLVGTQSREQGIPAFGPIWDA